MARLFITLYIGMVGTIVAFVVMLELMANTYYNLEDRDTAQTISGYMEMFYDLHDAAGPEVMFKAMDRTAEMNQLVFREVTDPELLKRPELSELPASGIYMDSLDPEDEDAVYFRLKTDNKVYLITPDRSAELWRQAETINEIFFWGVFLLSGLALGLWSYLLQRKLKKLERSAIQISQGDFSARAPMQFQHRVGNLNGAFNQMAERVEHLIASHKRLTNAVAHELRTPIFRLQCQLELLEHGQAQADHQRFVQGMEEDLNELDLMVDELLSYARMERVGMSLETQRLELNQWLSEQRPKLARSCQHPLAVEISEPLKAEFDPRLLMRAMTNLVRNADRYAERRIEIRVLSEANFAVICVDDDGCGIPEQDRERVLEPFERLDTARNRQTGGHGLGLSIVREILSQHGGRLLISESPLGGARIAIYLPLN